MPILGSDLVKTGVQDAIFDKIRNLDIFFTKSDKYGQIRTSTEFLAVSLHRQNRKTRPGLSLTDTYKTPSFPFMRARELKGI